MLSSIKNFAELEPHIVKQNVLFGSGKVAKEYSKLKKVQAGIIETNRFDDQSIALESFDWQNGYDNRNWWWQLQALPFLAWYVNAYNLMNDDEKKLLLIVIKEALFRWVERSEMDDIKSPLMWHDHASAYRLRNIVKWVNFLIINDIYTEVLTLQEQYKIIATIDKHLCFLKEDRNYSQYTNHGFDQMMIVYEISLLWQNQNILQEIGDIAESRLEDELDHAFTEEGVHVENSPHYQKFMLSRAELLIALERLGDKKLCKKASLVIDNATAFLKAITMPNGYVPMIGDTIEDDKGLLSDLSSDIEFFDYSKSGYYIAKGLAKDGKAVHLVFKCSHISVYHRHDDDLSFNLYYDDRVIFGDGGLGFYQEGDDRRKFLRSPAAHNTIYPVDISTVRVPEQLINKPLIKVLEPGLIVATTSMYGGVLQRTLDIRNLENLNITIKDKWLELPSANPVVSAVNFFIPEVIGANKISEKELAFEMADKLVNVKTSANKVSMYLDEAIISKKFAQFDKATRFGWKALLQTNSEIQTSINCQEGDYKKMAQRGCPINSFDEIVNSSDLKSITSLLKREVCLDKGVALKTQGFEGLEYAFYLYHPDGVEKRFYQETYQHHFDIEVCSDVIYKAVFYYSSIDGEKCSYEIDFQIVDDNKINIVKLK